MLSHRTHYAAGIPSEHVAECRTSYVSVWKSRPPRGSELLRSSSVSSGEFSMGFFRLKPNGDVVNELSIIALANQLMLTVGRRPFSVLPITAESLSIRARVLLSSLPDHVTNAGSKEKQLHYWLASVSAHNSSSNLRNILMLALAAVPWTAAAMLVRKRDGCSPVLQKPFFGLPVFVTVRYPQCQRDSCSEYRWAISSVTEGVGVEWVAILCFTVCLRPKSSIINSVSQPE